MKVQWLKDADAALEEAKTSELPGQFREKYPDSNWALKTAAWEH